MGYDLIHNSHSGDRAACLFLLVSDQVWGSSVPHKIRICVWRLLQSRLPTRDGLATRGIIPQGQNLSCPLCNCAQESCAHLFILCPKVWEVWYAIYEWIGVSFVAHHDLVQNFMQFGALFRGKRSKHFKFLIWCATVWIIWLTRNRIVFQEGSFDRDKVIAHIKFISWSWCIMRKGPVHSLTFSDWQNNPRLCLSILQGGGSSIPPRRV